ncbi:MAG: sulfotransferase [Pseudomonadota bacterium]
MNSSTQLNQKTEAAKQLLRSGEFQKVIALTREVLETDSAYPPAVFLLGVAQRCAGLGNEAVTTLRHFIKLQPAVPQGHMELGLAELNAGRLEAAKKSLLIAVDKEPKLSAAWRALAQIHSIEGDDDEAARVLAAELLAGDVAPPVKKASGLFYQGRVGIAEGICRDYLRTKPADVNAIRLLADIGFKLRMMEEAGQLYLRCLELAPEQHTARYKYAQVLARQNRYDIALAQVEILLRKDPADLSFQVLHASTLAQSGEYREAHKRFRAVLKQIPDAATVWTSYGHSLRYGGKGEEAIDAYRRAIALAPDDGEAWWSLANLKTVTFTEAEVGSMKAKLKQLDGHSQDKAHLAFALGKALEDSRKYDESFSAYALGNDIKKMHVAYKSVNTGERADHIITCCDAPFFQTLGSDGNPDSSPIFIVGLPRSGSTLMEQILASHSQVDASDELHFITRIAARLEGRRKRDEERNYPSILMTLSRDERIALGQEYLDAAAGYRRGAPYFIDKLPNNFVHIGLIRAILPNATIVDARRAPMAACFANYKQLFAEGQPFTYSLDDIGNYYADYIKLMDHWRSVLPGWILTVQYEEVVEHLEQQVSRLLNHCGLPFEEACVNFHENKRAVRTASSEQVRQPIFRDALDQWRNYQQHLEPLNTLLVERQIIG